jgi:hypothetical protein
MGSSAMLSILIENKTEHTITQCQKRISETVNRISGFRAGTQGSAFSDP